MSSRSPYVFLAFAFVVAALGEQSLAQSKSTRVMVVNTGVLVKNRDGSQVAVQLGDVLTTAIHEGEWLWVPQLHGWIPEKDTVPLSKAVSYFTKAIRKDPSAAAWHHRGLAHAALGDYRKALDDLGQAIVMQPGDASLRVNRGNVYRDMDDAEKALVDYNRALEISPRFVSALNNRGLIFSAQQKYDQAMLDFSAAIRIRPGYADPLNHRGVVHWKQGRVKEARQDYEAARRLNPGMVEPHYNLAVLAQSEGKFALAVANYQAALQRNRDFVPANNDLAWLLATCEDDSVRNPDLAVAHATRACQLTALKNANAIDTLAAALASAGRYDEAVRRVEQAIKLSAEDAKQPMNARRQLYLARQSFVDRG